MLMFALYWVLALACWGFALAFGGASAKAAFWLFCGAMAGTSISTGVVTAHGAKMVFGGAVSIPLLVTDFLYFIGLYLLALRSRNYWPIWSAGFQLLCVLTHFGPLLDPVARPKLYRALETVWILPMLLTMAIGIGLDRQHMQSHGKAA